MKNRNSIGCLGIACAGVAAAALAACSIDPVTFTPSGEDCGAPPCPAVCGNSRIEDGETCDDGNRDNGDGCDENCHLTLCGDGIVAFGEVCDDGNLSCGTCSADCQTFGSGAAQGSIAVVIADDLITPTRQSFTLHDGIIEDTNDRPVTFEFTGSGGVLPGNIPIMLLPGQNATTVRNLVRDAINNVEVNAVYTLRITATVSGATGRIVTLTNDRSTSLGNEAITANVLEPSFTVTGMAGGAGGDCAKGTPCEVDRDCVSSVCEATTPTKTCM
jgi:cysteine-rich repeat protein